MSKKCFQLFSLKCTYHGNWAGILDLTIMIKLQIPAGEETETRREEDDFHAGGGDCRLPGDRDPLHAHHRPAHHPLQVAVPPSV